MLYTKEVPLKYEVDVFVAGGGPAGVAAAVCAAREGKRVYLIENNGCFGGSGTSGLVPCFAQFTDGVHMLSGGFGEEIRSGLFAEGEALGRGFYSYRAEDLKKLYDTIIQKEENIQFSFFTRLIDVIAENGRVENVILAAKSGIFASSSASTSTGSPLSIS